MGLLISAVKNSLSHEWRKASEPVLSFRTAMCGLVLGVANIAPEATPRMLASAAILFFGSMFIDVIQHRKRSKVLQLKAQAAASES